MIGPLLMQRIVSPLLLIILFLQSGCGDDSSHRGGIGVPQGVRVVAANSSLSLSWEPVAGAESYNIYLAAQSGVTKDNYGSLAGGTLFEWNESPRIIRELQNDTTYYLVVTAKNGALESSESMELGASPLAIPAPPSGVNAAAGDGQVAISWSAKAGESYNIYWSRSPGVSFASCDGVISSLSSPQLHSTLDNGTTYYYAISAVNTHGESPLSGEVSATPASPAASLVTVRGSLHYEDKEYGRGGFTGTYLLKPIRYAAVEVVDSASSVVLAGGNLDKQGQFDLSFTPSAATSIYVRVISQTGGAGVPPVQVKNLSAFLQSAAGANITVSPGGTVSTDMTVPVSSVSSGFFNILHVLTVGGEFIKSLSGTSPPLINAYWQSGNSFYGTYFCRASDADPECINGEGVYLLGGSGFSTGDHEEFDDDVIWHEYGHFVAYKYSRDDSPGGVHFLSSNDLDLRLAWSEGWSTFFLSAVKDWALVNNPSLLSVASGTPSTFYLDTRDSAFFKFDIAQPSARMVYSSNEVAVANVLWKVMKETPSGLNGIWDAFSDYIPAVHNAALPVNMEAFWDGWLYNEILTPSDRNALESLFKERKINYSADLYESDDTFASAGKGGAGSSEVHTLYAGDNPAITDSDYLAFDALEGLTYRISTGDLINGSDTYLKLFGRDGFTLLDENDNGIPDRNYTAPYNKSLLDGVYHENDGTTLASTIVFMPYSTGTYYLEVSTSPNRPLSAGRYGSYNISVEIQ
ncbi:MAG: fibronectin type III domain-containing protein [Deltaproteobacteria bacterium]|nr:fibronectin type III domain-containing protein [Deltaproteobacteria bacterium]